MSEYVPIVTTVSRPVVRRFCIQTVLTFDQVAAHDEDSPITPNQGTAEQSIPNSPPPSFRSRASSRRTSLQNSQTQTEAERSLADAFAGPSDDESDDENESSRRLVETSPTDPNSPSRPDNQRRMTEIPAFNANANTANSGRVYGGGSSSTRDGVFANITAKPTRQDMDDEKPPVCSTLCPHGKVANVS